ncbi:helix-turn-helix transcriptional regulator [Thalassobacillus devorans]|uniref:helix-turn-helix transcriptional regulator n=1 Tax=Thalassobacillus devorans TaxID=279813 RepID=UPI0004AD18DA|nr:winged helix-turn-helix transcriptional regulator [Thalassobacillus devorans]
MKQSSTKETLLLLLKKNNTLTISELAEKVGISEIAVRKHIHDLERQKLVQARQVRQSVGRPLNYYELTEKGQHTFTSHYESFSVELLKDIESLYGKPMVYDLLKQRAERLKKEFQTQMPEEDFHQRVEKLAHIQEQNGYMVELEKNNDYSYTLKQYNCPIWNIARNYQGMCGQELRVFSNLLEDSKVVAEQSMVSGEACCAFQITHKSE